MLNKHDFEYDVYSLTKSFYPTGEVHQFYLEDQKEQENYSILIDIRYQEDSICISFMEDAVEKAQRKLAIEYYKDRKDTKNQLKRLLYEILARQTGRTLAWGTLSGIRPTKIPMGLIESGMRNADVAEYLRKTYLLSNEKTSLSIAIANQERAILKDIDYEKGYSLYVGIPFCPSICLYCSFSSYPLKQWEKKVDQYVDTLCYEIRKVAPLLKDRMLNTIYMGGGTPTTLNPDQLDRVLKCLGENYSYEHLREFTVEAGRPDSITREKLEVLKKYPVTRISVNPQTMNQKTLDIIGRRHTVEDTVQAYTLARELGFDNINMDLIVGLPGETREDVADTLKKVKELNPDSLTVHSLAVKRAARLNMFKDKYQEMTFENSQEIMDMVMKDAMDMGMNPYYLYRQKNMKGNFENVGYARPEKAGIYNILIMEEKQPILALGAGGASKYVFDHGERIERTENVKDVINYMERVDEMIERKRVAVASYLQGGDVR